MLKSQLKEMIKNFEPYTKLVSAEKCISAFEALLDAHKVDFDQLPEMDANRVIRWGLPFTFIDKDCLEESLFEKIVKSILKTGFPPKDTFAEIQAVSLLLAIGATSGKKIQTHNSKVHDFDLNWQNEKIEIEVTKASIKDAHTLCTDQATEICDKIFSISKSFDIHLYIADLFSDSSRRKLIKAAQSIKCGQEIDENCDWQLQGVKIKRDIYDLYTVGKGEQKPSWWPTEVANLFILKQFGASPESKTAPPQVRINYAVPLTGYLNPAKNKARDFQGSRKGPFLIVIEVNNLPNAVAAFNTGINEFLRNWPHISGILLFFDYLTLNEIGWEFKLFVNPTAKRPLPKGLIDKLGKDSNMRLVKNS